MDFLKKGGNKRFKEFLREYNVPDNATMDFKYMIRASSWYRKRLAADVQGREVEDRPDKVSGLEMLEIGFNPYPSIDIY